MDNTKLRTTVSDSMTMKCVQQFSITEDAASAMATVAASEKIRTVESSATTMEQVNSQPMEDKRENSLPVLNTDVHLLIIKQTVLKRLSRPEDFAKYNMFAIEGKSIKFPLKVRIPSQFLSFILGSLMWNIIL